VRLEEARVEAQAGVGVAQRQPEAAQLVQAGRAVAQQLRLRRVARHRPVVVAQRPDELLCTRTHTPAVPHSHARIGK